MSNLTQKYWTDTNSLKVKKYMEQTYDFSRDRTIEDEKFVMLLSSFFTNRKVIEIGSGTGRFIPVWKLLNVEVLLTDWSDTLIQKLKNRGDYYSTRVSKLDICEKSLPEKFDIAFCTQVLLHIPPEKIKRAIANMAAMSDFLFIITWQDLNLPYSKNSDKIQSFNHNYKHWFKKLNLQLQHEFIITFSQTKEKPKIRKNIVYILKCPSKAT